MSKDTKFRINLDKIIASKSPKLYRKIPKFLLNYLKKTIHQDELNEILEINEDKYGVDFMLGVVKYFGLKLEVHGLDELPTDSRFIFVSNHPLGGLDGICLSAIIGQKYDHKIKYLVNDLLYYIENLKEIFIPINKYGSQSRQTSLQIIEAFKSDNQIITFPAGLCSRKLNGQISDLEWGKMFIQKAIEHKRDVVPIYFEGHNSNFFYSLANLRKKLGVKFNFETVYLPDEMFKNKKKTFVIHFGKPISWTVFDKSKSAKDWTLFVRNISDNLNQNRL